MDGNSSTSPDVETLRQAVDLVPGATLLLDGEGRLCRCNRAARRLLGLGPADDALPDFPDGRTRLRNVLAFIRRARGSVPVVLAAADGSHVGASARAIPPDGAGRPTHVLVSLKAGDDAGARMRILNRELDLAAKRQRLLSLQNRTLRETVEKTLPRLEAQAVRDSLTGLYNRRYFDGRLAREWQRARRQQGSIALVYADIDDFKPYNDSLGHHRGDRCLQTVARALSRSVNREFDRVCRIGGEEFALLLPMTDLDGARRIAERACRAIRRLALRHPDSAGGIVTASFGVGACEPAAGESRDAFVAAVDRAMYRAKRGGRDRVCATDEACDRPAETAASGACMSVCLLR